MALYFFVMPPHYGETEVEEKRQPETRPPNIIELRLRIGDVGGANTAPVFRIKGMTPNLTRRQTLFPPFDDSFAPATFLAATAKKFPDARARKATFRPNFSLVRT
ncbi:MAG: hypothetical protein CM15mP21_7500 [Hyphomicrobiales bacterium]|nr:MAG: hypothetical protein CM15mP21_7500 [Hyphomicrobiales bacterium]